MPLRHITDATQWDAFVAAQPRAQFTQSWAWGAFREARGQNVIRLKGEGAAALFYRVPTPFVGGYWYAPRGPVAENTKAAEQLLNTIVTQEALPGRALFWRVEPAVKTMRMPRAFRQSHMYMPATTLLIDLTHTEEALQQAMHEKTRYNIRVAERRGVTVRTATDTEAIDTFVRLTEETAVRDNFRSQPSEYIRATFQALAPAGMARIRIAEKEGTPLAASFEVQYGDTVTYLYGASSSTERNAMAPYALHWNAIQHAQRAGARYYDFYGINPSDTNAHYYKSSWEGVTRFKRGWGGEEVTYMGTWELPRMPRTYAAFRTMRPH